jgi:O-antigen ligase
LNTKGILDIRSGIGLAVLVLSTLVSVTAVLADRLALLAAAPLLLLLIMAAKDLRNLYHLLLFSIPFSAEVDVTATLGTDFPDEPLMWLLTVLLFFKILIHPERARADAGKNGRLIATILFLHLAWIVVSTVLSTHPLLSFKYLAAKGWYVASLCLGSWYFLRTMADLRRAAAILTASMSMAAVLVLAKHAALGMGFDSVNRSVEPLFRNHVNYGALLACLAPVPVAAFLLNPRRRTLYALLILLWATALFYSYSRGAWLAVAAGLLAVMAMRYKALWPLMAGGAVVLLAGLLYLAQGNRYLDYSPEYEQTIYHQEFGDHLQATYKMRDISTMERFHRWIAAFRMTEGHLLHGYGPNTFYHEYRAHTVNSFRTYVSDNPEKSTVHNYLLLLLVEQGLPGMLLFTALVLAMLHACSAWLRRADTREERIAAAVVSAAIAVIAVLNMLSDLVESDKVGTLFFLCAGLLIRFSDGSARKDSEKDSLNPA